MLIRLHFGDNGSQGVQYNNSLSILGKFSLDFKYPTQFHLVRNIVMDFLTSNDVKIQSTN